MEEKKCYVVKDSRPVPILLDAPSPLALRESYGHQGELRCANEFRTKFGRFPAPGFRIGVQRRAGRDLQPSPARRLGFLPKVRQGHEHQIHGQEEDRKQGRKDHGLKVR